MAPFTVALDARQLGGERKGIGRYLHTLLSGISAQADPPGFVFLADRELDVDYPGLDCETVVAARWPVYLWEQLTLPRLLRRASFDLFHAPGNALPLRPPAPTVLTLHDAMMFERSFHTGEANRYYLYQSWVLKRAASRCAAIITVSKTSAQDIARRLGPAAAARLVVIEEAVDPLFFEARTAGELAAFRGRHGLPDRYLLHLGAAFPRKNTRLTLEAYKLAAARADVPALVIGGVARDDAPVIKCRLGETGLEGRVIIQPYLPPAEHALLVAAAEVLLYPSAYEGFGLPALEAMAVGVPVVSSRRGALPETCGEAAFYVDTEPEAIAAAITELAADEEARRRLSAAGREHVKKYSPARMAARTLEVYREALAAKKS
jgi:glycosyltransferase involved in cell wall biosynthesis